MLQGFEYPHSDGRPEKNGLKIGLVGRGKFAREFKRSVDTNPSVDYLTFADEVQGQKGRQPDAILHIGSGRQLLPALDYASVHKVPFIQAATGQDADLQKALERPETPVVLAPNLSLRIVQMLDELPAIAAGARTEKYQLSIEESHQNTKRTVPGTAFLMADILGIPRKSVRSIRDLDVVHSSHRLIGRKLGEEKDFVNVTIFGHDEYIDGAIEISRSLRDNKFRLHEQTYTPSQVLNLPTESARLKNRF